MENIQCNKQEWMRNLCDLLSVSLMRVNQVQCWSWESNKQICSFTCLLRITHKQQVVAVWAVNQRSGQREGSYCGPTSGYLYKQLWARLKRWKWEAQNSHHCLLRIALSRHWSWRKFQQCPAEFRAGILQFEFSQFRIFHLQHQQNQHHYSCCLSCASCKVSELASGNPH